MNPINLPKILQPFRCMDLIRLGKDNDGGYLVNKLDIFKTTKLVSFGVKDDISFETDFYNMNNCPIDAYDGTIEDQKFEFFVEDKKLIHKNIGRDINFVDTLNQNNIFLKCDIEGSEYDFIHDIIRQQDKLCGLCIEFHHIDNYNNFNLLTNLIGKFDLKLVHTHINNWGYSHSKDKSQYFANTIELTFTSSFENIKLDPFLELPHPLDMPNNPNDDEFAINFN